MRRPDLGTRFRPLAQRTYYCHGGPLAGADVVLTENSPNTAFLECSAQHGRYLLDARQRLVWTPDKVAA